MAKRVTLNDVSTRAGVSRSTVSLVINGHPSIPEGTRARVLAAMSDLGYVYNRVAASLRTRRTSSIALIATEVGNSYFAEIVRTLDDRLAPTGIAVVVGYSRDDASREMRLLRTFIENGVDGIILLPAWRSNLPEILALTEASQTPLVTIARPLGDDAASVTTDNLRAGAILGAHLAELGVRDVVLLGGRSGSPTAADRLNGLRSSLEGIARLRHIESPVTSTGGAEAVRGLLPDGHSPDAIVALSDAVAVGVFAALHGLGLVPGRDVAVASFDDTPEARYQVPPLTSVATFPDHIAERCAEVLLSAMVRSPIPSGNDLVEPSLRVRQSTSDWRLTRRR